MKKNYFEGYYIKIQGKEDTIICIPSLHIGKDGTAEANLQIAANDFQTEIRKKEFIFQKGKNKFYFKIGDNIFTHKGCQIMIKEDGITVDGKFRYDIMTPLSYDIMGCFQYIPFLQCRHSVLSMHHTVTGRLKCRQKNITVKKGLGYIEGDRGSDFPQKYFWMHTFIEGGSVMLSIATVPLIKGKWAIKGCIAVVHYKGKEYRIATYLGGNIERRTKRCIILKQGKYRLAIRILGGNGSKQLSAPKKGVMRRNIEEAIKANVFCTFIENGEVLFDTISKHASYELEW